MNAAHFSSVVFIADQSKGERKLTLIVLFNLSGHNRLLSVFKFGVICTSRSPWAPDTGFITLRSLTVIYEGMEGDLISSRVEIY